MKTRPWLLVLAAATLLVCTAGVGDRLGVSIPTASADPDVTVDLNLFYESLSPYGDWVRVEPYGWTWVPVDVDYGWRPYWQGHWVWLEGWGWTWVSEEPWAWAVYHYGRWLWIGDYGWVWVPGTVWAGAWVEFRYADSWIGWSPLPPLADWRLDAGPVTVEVATPAYAWTFVPTRFFADVDVSARAVRSVHNAQLLAVTRPAGSYAVVDGRVTSRAIEPAVIERAAGKPVARVKAHDLPKIEGKAGLRVDGDTLHVFRPKVEPRASKAEPPVRAPQGDAGEWARRREEQLKKFLDGQRHDADQDLDDGHAVPPGQGSPMGESPMGPPVNPPPMGPPAMGGDETPMGPPQGVPGGGNADDAQRRRLERQKYLEEEQKRLQEWLERERRRRSEEKGRDAPPSGMGMNPKD
jgi:hypothetical protein